MQLIETSDPQRLYLERDGLKREVPLKTILEMRKNHVYGPFTPDELQKLWDSILPDIDSPVWPTTNPHLPIKHPAKFSDGFIDTFRQLLLDHLITPWQFEAPLVLDPFAGVGTIHQLRPEFTTIGVEIEPEWANQSQYTLVGDSTKMNDWWTEKFQAVVTSPTYGNRMADHHDAKETCQQCNGNGWYARQLDNYGNAEQTQCDKCLGTGFNHYKRNTYKHTLGRDLNPRNTGREQFGKRYQELHRHVYQECHRVLERSGVMIVNVSDHIRYGSVIPVTNWHLNELTVQGFSLLENRKVETHRNGFGANGKVRVDHENILVFRRD